MKFGIFYEHQLPRPWHEGSELELFQTALDQVELADRLGIDYAWEVEHHFLEEYSHSSAPEVFLAAASQRSQRIRLAHGIVLCPPAYSHPARIAERIATLDLVSNGRVEFGTGESASRMELEGFGIDPTHKREMWLEAIEQIALMMSQNPYRGYAGKHFSMPPRNVIPKPVQKPHPPMWVACSSRQTIHVAAQLGLGALTFAFVDPTEAQVWVEDYYETFKKECVPIGQTVNPNIAMVTGFMCHEKEEEAVRRGLEGFKFFAYALAHYYIFGTHVPGQTDVFEGFKQSGFELPNPANRGGIGTPTQVREHLRAFERAGVDQVVFIQQGGNNKHEDICASLKLFAAEVMPEFKQRETQAQRQKMERLAPHIEAAMARKRRVQEAAAVPEVYAFGRTIVEGPQYPTPTP